ncbi:C39 family peptidase [Cupriavidus basilensis]|uniref:C39 family peptidase n=1 Tax=Cupriavidus basilensis TaxID=68895 RepID=UPI0039F6B265
MRALFRVTGACMLLVAAFSANGQSTMTIDIDGQPMLRKPVKSMLEMRYQNMMRQQLDFSCGAAAVGTLLRYGYGYDLAEPRIVEDMLRISDADTVVKNGFSMLDMRNYVETLGLRGRGFRVDYSALRQLKIPVITLLDVNGYLHFVVVRKAIDGRVFVADPALGNRIIKEEDFAANWNGLVFAIVGRPFDPNSPLLDIAAPALRDRTNAALAGGMVPAALDFGLIRMDYF